MRTFYLPPPYRNIHSALPTAVYPVFTAPYLFSLRCPAVAFCRPCVRSVFVCFFLLSGWLACGVVSRSFSTLNAALPYSSANFEEVHSITKQLPHDTDSRKSVCRTTWSLWTALSEKGSSTTCAIRTILQCGMQTTLGMPFFFVSGPCRSDCRHEDRPGGSVRTGDDDHQSAGQQRRGMHQDDQLVQVRKRAEMKTDASGRHFD